MKKTLILPLAAVLSLGIISCGNSDNSTSENNMDTAASVGTAGATDVATSTETSTGSYAAQADSFRVNSEAGNYLDARSGKSMRINVDPSTGQRTNAETGEPVWRYVDRRNWGVYGGDSWDTVGTARMENNELRYRSNNDQWETYDKRWKSEDDKLMSDWKTKIDKGDGDVKMKNDAEDAKIKMDKDGDVKIKTKDGKTKIDADDGEVKQKD